MEGSADSDGVGEAGDKVGSGVDVEIAVCVTIPSVGLVSGVGTKLLQDICMTAIRNKEIDILPKVFTFYLPLMFCGNATGLRYL